MIQRSDVTEHGEIMERREPYIPTELEILDPTAPTGVAVTTVKPEWIATISAGYKKTNDKGVTFPQVSRDGTIYIPDDKEREKVPELVAALKATGGKKLTIAFTSNNLYEIVLQRYVRYSASTLEVFGDKRSLKFVAGIKRDAAGKPYALDYQEVFYGSKEYAELAGTCKAETSVLFVLAEWDPETREPQMIWPGEVGHYRIRFTSRNSARSIQSRIINAMHLTKDDHGRPHILGVPFELSLGYRDVAGSDLATGKMARRTVPVWNLALRPPGGFTISMADLRQAAERAMLNAGPIAALPPPSYTIEHALLAAPNTDDDLDSIDLTDLLASKDPVCDARYFRERFHSMVKNDPLLSTDNGRHKFVKRFTSEQWPDQPERHVESLEVFLGGDDEHGIPPARESDANKFIAKVGAAMEALDIQRRQARMKNGVRPASTTTTVEPEPDKEPPPTEPASAPQPEPAPAPEEEQPIAAEAEDEPDIGQHDEAPVEGEFREEGSTPAAEPPVTNEHEVKLATDKQKQEIQDYAPPSVRNAIDFETLTFDEAAMTLESIGRGSKK